MKCLSIYDPIQIKEFVSLNHKVY